MYLDINEIPANKIAKNLIKLLSDSDITEATSLEEVFNINIYIKIVGLYKNRKIYFTFIFKKLIK